MGGAAVIAYPMFALALSFAHPPGSPDASRRIEPLIGTSSTLLFEAFVSQIGAEVQRDYRLASKPMGIDFGVQWYWRRGTSFRTGGWRGWALTGVSVMLPRGLFPVMGEFAAGYEFKVWRRTSVVTGAALSSHVTLPDPAFSHMEARLVLGLSLRRFDILYMPGLALPLTRDRVPGPGGFIDHRVAALPVPLALALRVKLGRRD